MTTVEMRTVTLKSPQGREYQKRVRCLPALHDFQKEDAARCMSQKSILLNLSIGSGKTWVVLAYIQSMIDFDAATTAVVITKKSTIRPTWAAIMDKHFPGMTYEVLTDKSRAQRAAIWQKRPRPDVYLMNYELSINPMDRVFLETLFEEEKALLCADECHYLRNVETDRHQQWISMADRAVGVVGATATPIQTSPDDWYGMLSMLRYPLTPYHRWKFDWCRCIETWVPSPGGPRRIWTPVEFLPKKAEELRQIALRWTVHRPPGTVELPGLTEETRLVELTPEERKAYNEAETVLSGIKLSDLDQNPWQLGSALQAYSIMRAVCSGKMSSKVSAKDQELLDLIPELTADGGKFLLYTPFRKTVERLEGRIAQAFPHLKVVTIVGGKTAVQRGNAVRDLQTNPQVRVLMMTDAGAEGVDGIQRVANRIVMFDKITNPALEDQIVGRVYRQGQKSPVLRINFKTQGTIEEDDSKTNRRRRMMEMVDHLSQLELTDYGRNLLHAAQSRVPGTASQDKG